MGPGKTNADRAARVRLIPWDPNNEAHYRRMYEQRVACGWKQEMVQQWKESVLSGRRCFYWVTLAQTETGREEMLNRHFEKYEKDREPLADTASIFNGTSREPTGESFHPIGHAALERQPELDAAAGLDASKTLWVMSLYVSWAFQGTGLGRATMAALEQTAASSPFNATTIALDTITSECQAELMARTEFYDGKVKTTEEWYDKQGYESFYSIPEDQCYRATNPATGEPMIIWQVCKKKQLRS